MTKEQKFYKALQDVFVGAKIEGEGGFINLMRIKSSYYKQIEKLLESDIDKVLEKYPKFREELFDKLYSFFNRYFTESGSIYFDKTPFHNNIYEKVYTDEKDVILFWKTQMLYYVKTDRIFRSMPVEFEGLKFYFDAKNIENKKANEKRSLVFELRQVREDGTIVFTVAYSEKGRKTKTDEILKALKKKGVAINEEELEKALKIFGKQSEVDFFINKNAKAFLQEQFKLWSYQYFWEGAKEWSGDRVNQLQILKDIAFKVIDFISQFEDELVKIWNKPKFVRNSNYVITLDKITDKNLIEKILKHSGIKEQIKEWRELGIVDDKFKVKDISENKKYAHLPIDTKYFKDLELEILALFDDLDNQLDGWLIKSENYQALNTILPKFKERVKCIHIDPPYNTETSGFLYVNTYQHSSWLTMMENRIRNGFELISRDGSFLCHIDENEYEHLQLLFKQFSVANAGTVVWDKRNPMNAGRGVATQHEYIIWRSRQETPIYLRNDSILLVLKAAEEIVQKHGSVTEKAQKEYAAWVNGNSELTGGEKAYRFLDKEERVYRAVSLRAPEPRIDPKFHKPLIHPVTGKPCPVPPNGFSRTPETLQRMVKRGEIIFGADETIQPNQKMFLTKESRRQISSVIQDARKGKADLDPLGLDFPYCHPVSLYGKLIGAASASTDDIVLDFFAGSGTTAHAVINSNREDSKKRKYILVEMGNYFISTIIPRVKKVIFSDNWKNGKAYEGKGISHFIKYYELEQYEEALANCKYADGDLFNKVSDKAYQDYVFMKDEKMLKALEIDYKNNKVKVDLSKLYDGIDVAETLSNLTGKWIKAIRKDEVEFADGTKINTRDLDYKLIKPLIWWE
ncbi:MAG: site-specific DNA-methyltransferase [Proteobacteria bacterium]|nr:site-specific DNA-methyltransferase [Pseudomonadota bacterium]